MGEVMGTESSGEEGAGALTVVSENSGNQSSQLSTGGATPKVVTRSTAAVKRGPSVHRYNLGTWTAYHAARIAAGSIAGAASRGTEHE